MANQIYQRIQNRLQRDLDLFNTFEQYLRSKQKYDFVIHRYCNEHYAKIVINVDGCQIGRITYQFDCSGNFRQAYVKNYKQDFYGYKAQDKIFFMIDYFFHTGKILVNLEELIGIAREIQEKEYCDRIEFCKNNPKYKFDSKLGIKVPRKRKCERKNLLPIISRLVYQKAETNAKEESIKHLLSVLGLEN